MKLQVAVLPGDGIGPEVTRQAVAVLQTVADVCGHDFQFESHRIGGTAIEQDGTPLPERTLSACLESDAVLLGAVGARKYDHCTGAMRPEAGLLALRQALGGYANLRPVQAYDAIADCSPLREDVVRGADILIVRELLGGLYFAQPRALDEDGLSAYNTMRYSVDEIERVAHVAFREARTRRKHVTSVDKANILETSQLWRRTVTETAKQYPDVKLEHALVDSFAMQMITTPARYDVVLTENLFGDILSDEAAVICGSLGMLASASIGGRVALYEPVHGSAPDIAGRGVANPFGAIQSAALLLRYSAGLIEEAEKIQESVRRTLARGLVTPDLAGRRKRLPSGTDAIGEAVVETVADLLQSHMAYHAV
ncbi:MAG: 3-isopropylmalate dehydrogenase [Candidatus Korobacteraceae bacterium]|jgi:3-isopropylmalate dehydrogenase